MRTEKHLANGKEYELTIEQNGLGGTVTPRFQGKLLGITYSVSIEVAQDFQFYREIGALEELVKIVKGDLDRGVGGDV